MRIKKNKQTKEEKISIRCSTEEKNKMNIKANLYTDGNLSEWILYSAINYKPSKEEIEKGS